MNRLREACIKEEPWVDPGELSTSTARSNRFGKKTMLCVWWHPYDLVYYELVKPGETINTQLYRQQIINFSHALLEKWLEWVVTYRRVSCQHSNSPAYCKSSQGHSCCSSFRSYPLYSLYLVPFDFRWMVRFKRATLLLARYPQTDRKMSKVCS